MAIPASALAFLNIAYAKAPVQATDYQSWATGDQANTTWVQAVQGWATSTTAQTTYPYLAAPSIGNAKQYVLQVYANLFGKAEADIDPAHVTYWTNWLNQYGNNTYIGADGTNYGISGYQALALAVYEYSATAEEKTALANRQQISQQFTSEMLAVGSATFTETQSGNGWNIISGVTDDPATVTAAEQQITDFVAGGGGQTGQTFTFTTAIDSFSGGQANDTFVGDNGGGTATVQAADQVNGGGGRDTFKYYDPTTALPSMVDVEDVQLLGDQVNVGGINFAPLANKGLQTVTFVDATFQNDVTVNGLSGIAFGVNNVTTTDKAITGDFGTATSATFTITGSTLNQLTLDSKTATSLKVNAEGTGANDITELTADTAASANLEVGGTGSLTVKTLTANALTTLTASNQGALTVNTLTANALTTLTASNQGALTISKTLSNTVKTIDASKNTGGVTLSPGVSDLIFTGGSGDDKLTFNAGSLTAKDSLDGGTGKDTLVLKDVALTDDQLKAVNAVKNFDTLGFAGDSATIDVSKVTAFTNYLFSTAGDVVVTNATSGNTLTLDKSANSTSLTNKSGDTVSNLTLSGTGISTGWLTLTDIKTVNLNSTATTADQTVSNVFGAWFGANPDSLKIVVTGNQAVEIGEAQAVATGVTISATAFTGQLTASGTTKVDALTGGSGNDVLTGLQGADILTGGSGNDTFSYINGGGFVGAGDSNAGSLTGAVSFDTVADFTASADKLKSAGFVAANLVAQETVQAAVNASPDQTFAGVLAAASVAMGATKYGAFQFSGNTYVLGNDGDAGTVGANDLLVQLTGTHTLTATNFVV